MVGIKAILDALQVRNVPLFLSVPYHDTRCVCRDRVGTNVRHTHSNKRMAFLLPSCSDARRSCWRRSRRPTTRHLGISSAPAPPPCGATGAIACQQTVPTTQVVASAPPGVQRAWLPPGCRWRLSITTRFLLGSFSTTTAQATSGRCSLRISRGQTPPQAHLRTVGTRAALNSSELQWRHHTVASHRCENRISFAMPFCIQTDHDSPRQARDKQRENSKRDAFFAGMGTQSRGLVCGIRVRRCERHAGHDRAAGGRAALQPELGRSGYRRPRLCINPWRRRCRKTSAGA